MMIFRKRRLLTPFVASLLLAALVVPSYAPPPAWWTEANTKIINDSPGLQPDNYAPANLGQLKQVAKQAKRHLDDKLAEIGGAGATINNLVAGFQTNLADNYAPINLGQLKAVAQPFYARLIAAGVNTRAGLVAHGYPSAANGAPADWPHAYPWNPNDPWNNPTPPGQQVDKSTNFSPANLGQLKMVFSFDAGQDTDSDGLSDWQELLLGINRDNPDSDGDGVADGIEIAEATDPK